MRVKFQVVVSSDDGAVSKDASSELQLATGLHGVDPSSAKQDFLTQADNLVRAISETQLPALYQAVDDEYAKRQAARDEERPSEAQERVKAKLSKLRQKKEQAAQDTAQDAAQAVQNAVPDADEPVKCTECGAEVPHDDAHYVTVVVEGKYNRDAVLCDACYDKLMAETAKANAEANNGGGE